MSSGIILFFFVALGIRLVALFISIKNEKKLMSEGAVEYGKRNSLAMTIVFLLFYFGCFFEAGLRKVQWDSITTFGIILWLRNFNKFRTTENR